MFQPTELSRYLEGSDIIIIFSWEKVSTKNILNVFVIAGSKGKDGSLHLLLSSMNRLNPNEHAIFSVQLFLYFVNFG